MSIIGRAGGLSTKKPRSPLHSSGASSGQIGIRHLMSELADLLRSELSDRPPRASPSARAAAAQSVHLDGLAGRLRPRFPADEVSAAVAQLISERISGWNYLKLVDLSEFFPSPPLAEALFNARSTRRMMWLMQRRLFLSGRTYRGPQGVPAAIAEMRRRSSGTPGPALGHLRRLREIASVRQVNRKPTSREWALAFALLGAALLGMAYAWSSLP